MIKEGIEKLVDRLDLEYREAAEIMREVMSGQATEAQLGSFLTALRIKGETVEEISAFASVMNEFCHRIHPRVVGRLVDTCGTGGDRVKTFNISTVSAFVVAGTGIAVAKHGNRAVTSKSGSADLLECLGINLDLNPESVEKAIEQVGIGFMYAPMFHPAMKYAINPRREIGIRTVFNLLGPLTNPAGANAQVLGVFAEEWVKPLAQVLRKLGLEEAMVVHGLDGLDELSTIGRTSVAWLRDQTVSLHEVVPRDFGIRTAKPSEITGSAPDQSAIHAFKLLYGVLDGRDPRRDAVILNAAAGIVVGSKADNIAGGVELAKESLESGAAYGKLKAAMKASGGRLMVLEEFERKYA